MCDKFGEAGNKAGKVMVMGNAAARGTVVVAGGQQAVATGGSGTVIPRQVKCKMRWMVSCALAKEAEVESGRGESIQVAVVVSGSGPS